MINNMYVKLVKRSCSWNSHLRKYVFTHKLMSGGRRRGAMFGKMLLLLLLFYKHVSPSPTPFSSSPLWVKVMPAAIPRSVVAKSFCLLSEPSSRWLHTMNPWEEVRRQFVPTQVSLSHFACSSLEFCQFYLCWKKQEKLGAFEIAP